MKNDHDFSTSGYFSLFIDVFIAITYAIKFLVNDFKSDTLPDCLQHIYFAAVIFAFGHIIHLINSHYHIFGLAGAGFVFCSIFFLGNGVFELLSLKYFENNEAYTFFSFFTISNSRILFISKSFFIAAIITGVLSLFSFVLHFFKLLDR